MSALRKFHNFLAGGFISSSSPLSLTIVTGDAIAGGLLLVALVFNSVVLLCVSSIIFFVVPEPILNREQVRL